MSDPVPSALRGAAAISWRVLVVAAALGLLALVLVQLQIVVLPVLVALLATTALRPPAEWLRARGVPAGVAAVVVFAAAIGIAALVLLALVPFVVHDLESSGGATEGLRSGVDRIREWLTDGSLGISESRVDRLFARIEEEGRSKGATLAGGALVGALLVAQLLASALLAAVLTFFFVKDGDSFWDWFVRLFPEERRPHVRIVGDEAWSVLGNYLRGTAMVAAIDGFFIGLAVFVIGVPFAVPLGLLTFVASFVPVLGSMAAGAVAILVALGTEGPVAAALVFGAIFIVQQTEGNLLAPQLIGRSVSLHPVAALLAVSVGGVLLGVTGAFVAVPLVAVIYASARVLNEREAEEDGRSPDPSLSSDTSDQARQADEARPSQEAAMPATRGAGPATSID